MAVKIEVLDPIECKINQEGKKILRPVLQIPDIRYVQKQFKKERKEGTKPLIKGTGNNNYFLSGFLPRVKKYLAQNNVPFSVTGGYEKFPSRPPKLPNIELRADQERLVERGRKIQRGLLVAPTGSGKTIMGIALVNCFPTANILWLAHTIDLVNQSADELYTKDHNNKIEVIGGGGIEKIGLDYAWNDKKQRKITIATVQTFKNFDPTTYCDQYDMVIVDEAHHVSKFDGMYYQVLRNLLAPVRIGLTATKPYLQEAVMACEGLLGPVIDEVTMQEGAELEILAKPKIRLIKVPTQQSVKALRKYADVYHQGIVMNATRNTMICNAVLECVEDKKTVLINVNKIVHGELLLEELLEMDIATLLVQGSTEAAVRTQIKQGLNDKRIECVIATSVFKEGVNIPTLNVCVNAAGGKSEIATLQSIGRGLRRTDTKKTVLIIDFIDTSHHYLANHSLERICLYSDMKWIGGLDD